MKTEIGGVLLGPKGRQTLAAATYSSYHPLISAGLRIAVPQHAPGYGYIDKLA
jgi:hypothetical protein